MAIMTITEALAEIKTIGARITKKQEFVLQNLGRPSGMRDPLEQSGGQIAAVKSERDSVESLCDRIVVLRRAIAKANAETLVTVHGKTLPISDWLIWKREVAPSKKKFLETLSAGIQKIRREASSRNIPVVSAQQGGEQTMSDYLVNIDERDLQMKIEEITEILGILDGQLSLKNATTAVEVE